MRIGKLLAAIFGSLILLVGAGMTTAGAVALAVTDADGWITPPTARVSTDTAAVVGGDINLELGEAIDDRTFVSVGDIPARIEVDSRNGKAIFIGIAPAEDVANYLAATSHVRAELFEDDVELFTATGSASLPVPEGESFWVASSADGSLDWDLTSGIWSVVIANADGSEGVDVAITASARIPFVEAIGIGLLVVGVLAIAGGAVMLYFGVRADPTRPSAATTAAIPSGPRSGSDSPTEPATIT